MSNDDNKTPQLDGDDGALRDPVLRRALDHAPDHDALPDPRTRDAIRKMAHNLATVPAPATPPQAAAPWWRRLFGGSETHARMPWNAAFATVLAATFVTVLWYREPVPDARLDGEAGVASAPPAASVPAPAAVPPAPTPAPAPAQPATEVARDAASGGSSQREDAVRRTAPAPVPADKPAAPAQVIAAAPPPPPAPAVVQPSPAPMAEQSAPAPRAFPRTEERREESEPENRQRRSRDAAGAPPAAPPSVRESADSSAAPALSAAQRSASANSGTEASGALRQAAPAAPAPAPAAAKATAEDTSAFSALDRWTSLNLTRAGQGTRQARGDTEGLAALVNAVARSATTPGAELAAPVEARLELYRGATLLAVLEIAGDRVRWTPQAGTGGGASIGTPPASTLAALRALLVRQ
jgi:hypothetical protein